VLRCIVTRCGRALGFSAIGDVLTTAADGRLAGICTRTDVLRARRRQFELEEMQPGWGPGGKARLLL
jgi:hypothetical protein